jgi:hypothetical protein
MSVVPFVAIDSIAKARKACSSKKFAQGHSQSYAVYPRQPEICCRHAVSIGKPRETGNGLDMGSTTASLSQHPVRKTTIGGSVAAIC